MAVYKPVRGDIVMLDFDPQAGSEQADRRPALVLSNSNYNAKGSLLVVCPITTKIKGWPFEVTLKTAKNNVQGVVLSDQVKSLDYKARNAKKVDAATPVCVDTVFKYVQALIQK